MAKTKNRERGLPGFAAVSGGLERGLIAISGAPCTGKTVTAVKLARALYEQRKKAVILLSPDLCVPSLAYIFPRRDPETLYSLGRILEKTQITEEDVLKSLVTQDNLKDFGFLGYRLSENVYSYPRPTEDKVLALFGVLSGLCDFVVADCSCRSGDLVSETAFSRAEIAIELVNPSVRSIAYSASDSRDKNRNVIRVLNCTDGDVFLPVSEAKQYFGNIASVFPYSRELKRQSLEGDLSEGIPGGKYRDAITDFIRKVI